MIRRVLCAMYTGLGDILQFEVSGVVIKHVVNKVGL
jgi:hypothetical protein